MWTSSIALAMLVVMAQAAGTTSPAQQPAATQGAATAPAADTLKPGEKKVRVICRDENATGSRMSKRRCITEADFARREEEATANFSAMQGSYTLPPSKGN